jgi:hypothetical protein
VVLSHQHFSKEQTYIQTATALPIVEVSVQVIAIATPIAAWAMNNNSLGG